MSAESNIERMNGANGSGDSSSNLATKTPFLIGVAGGTASGKVISQVYLIFITFRMTLLLKYIALCI